MKIFTTFLLVIASLTILVGAIFSSAILSLLLKEEKNEINLAKWAQLGDFLGGTLNPIFAFFALLALLYTIKLQSKALALSKDELSATREELEKTRIAQQEQSKSLELQNQATKLQMFENTFFKLFDLFNLTKNTLISNLSIKSSGYTKELGITVNGIKHFMNSEELNFWDKYSGSNSRNKTIELFLNLLKRVFNNNYNSFNEKYVNSTGAYFGQIYQIIKFVNESNIKNNQRYLNIFRAQFTKEELEFLFYHCLGEIGIKRFKELIEKYEFFEHMILNEDIEKQILKYDIKAFGENKKIIARYNELKESSNL